MLSLPQCSRLLGTTFTIFWLNFIWVKSRDHLPLLYFAWNLESVNALFQSDIFLRFYLFIFRERGREGEREGEKHQCVVASHTFPTGDLAVNPGMCPELESNWWPFGSQPMLNPLSYTSQGSICYFYLFIYLFLERGEGREEEREGEKHWCARETSIGCLSYAPQ